MKSYQPNVGDGDAKQRVAAALYQMVHSKNSVTRWTCRQIVAEKLVMPRSRAEPPKGS